MPWHHHRWQRNRQPLPSRLRSPQAEAQGLARFPMCPLLSHGHGEAEIRIHVCRNLHLGKCPAIHRLRRKGRAACTAFQGSCSCRKGKRPPCIKHRGQGPLCCCPSAPTASPGTDIGRSAISRGGHHAIPVPPAPQELNPCPLLQLAARRETRRAGAARSAPGLRSAEKAAAGSARSRRGSPQAQHHSGRGSEGGAGMAGGTGTHHPGVRSGSWVGGARWVPSSC